MTHSHFFINALSTDRGWVVEKDKDGFSVARQASDYEFVKERVK